jgi:enoyl-[acyl-carrier protein] reductase I
VSISQLLENKTAIVFGAANKRSIAWAVAKRFSEAGAKIILTYQDDRLLDKVAPLAEEVSQCRILRCDLTKPEEIESAFKAAEEEFGGLDILVHSVAYALREDLEGRYSDTSSEGFNIAHNVSSYTLLAAARAARGLFAKRGGGSIMAMTYYGSEKVIPNYNIMGVAKASLEANVRYLAADLGPENIRVNALSAGPLNTLAARGISGFMTMLGQFRDRAPLRRNTEPEEVADVALFLASDLSRGVTGETLYVDCGFHITGM